jgi:hypothetical protein
MRRKTGVKTPTNNRKEIETRSCTPPKDLKVFIQQHTPPKDLKVLNSTPHTPGVDLKDLFQNSSSQGGRGQEGPEKPKRGQNPHCNKTQESPPKCSKHRASGNDSGNA